MMRTALGYNRLDQLSIYMTTYTYTIKRSLTIDFVISSLLCGISRGGGTIDAKKAKGML